MIARLPGTILERGLFMCIRKLLGKRIKDLGLFGVELGELMVAMVLCWLDSHIICLLGLWDLHLELCCSPKDIDTTNYLNILMHI